jgi:hypothetical protein
MHKIFAMLIALLTGGIGIAILSSASQAAEAAPWN